MDGSVDEVHIEIPESNLAVSRVEITRIQTN